MITAKGRQRGTTLAELLVAVVFMAVCVSGIVGSVAFSQRNANFTRRRATALVVARTDLEKAMAEARAGTLVAKTYDAQSVSSLPKGEYVRTVTQVSGYTRLYDVTVTLTWSEPASSGSRTERTVLATQVRF